MFCENGPGSKEPGLLFAGWAGAAEAGALIALPAAMPRRIFPGFVSFFSFILKNVCQISGFCRI